MNSYEQRKIANFLWSLFKSFRSQIPEKNMNEDMFYDIKISGLQISMIRQKAKHFYKEARYNRS